MIMVIDFLYKFTFEYQFMHNENIAILYLNERSVGLDMGGTGDFITIGFLP